uniref:Uncharacterized protein n=1 Tax=Anguilla anguilla TaxID=7936 RepID=A0A0E9VLA5_ANGAN
MTFSSICSARVLKGRNSKLHSKIQHELKRLLRQQT